MTNPRTLHRTRAALTGLLLPALLAVVSVPGGAQTTPTKHHSKAKGALAGGAAGAVVGGPVGAVAGAAVGAEVQHHKNVKARRRAAAAHHTP